MRKIPTLFARNWETDKLVRNEVTPGCEWVLAGEGTPTRKWDGACCLVRDGKLYKRYDEKPGRTAPPDFELVEADPTTGHRFGWVSVGGGPEDRWFREAWENECAKIPCEAPGDGTYELVGPKVNGNKDGVGRHVLIRHGCDVFNQKLIDLTFDGIRRFLSENKVEGIVWHHPDGRMAKIKRRDFGFGW